MPSVRLQLGHSALKATSIYLHHYWPMFNKESSWSKSTSPCLTFCGSLNALPVRRSFSRSSSPAQCPFCRHPLLAVPPIGCACGFSWRTPCDLRIQIAAIRRARRAQIITITRASIPGLPSAGTTYGRPQARNVSMSGGCFARSHTLHQEDQRNQEPKRHTQNPEAINVRHG